MNIEQFMDLQARLGHTWEDPELLWQALRHTSWCNEHPVKPEPNERLEFLGDSVLDLLSAEYLMAQMPEAREGRLSQARAQLVRECALGSRARAIGLGEMLLVGKGQDYIRNVESVLADAMEAIIGSAYRDGGITAARQVALHTGVLR